MSVDTGDQQRAILLIHNANLAPDTINSLTFQVTTVVAVRTPTIGDRIVRATFVEIEALLTSLKTDKDLNDFETVKAEVRSVRN